ncbi:MAG: hypothetical protein SFY66_13010 [Oculatellaceae cyanobacterium bins.114]|nr:hypothetical protein [Oculatellaceae cyanobacterium bins.114]
MAAFRKGQNARPRRDVAIALNGYQFELKPRQIPTGLALPSPS